MYVLETIQRLQKQSYPNPHLKSIYTDRTVAVIAIDRDSCDDSEHIKYM